MGYKDKIQTRLPATNQPIPRTLAIPWARLQISDITCTGVLFLCLFHLPFKIKSVARRDLFSGKQAEVPGNSR